MNITIISKSGGGVPAMDAWAATTGNSSWISMVANHVASVGTPGYESPVGDSAFDAMLDAYLSQNGLELVVN